MIGVLDSQNLHVTGLGVSVGDIASTCALAERLGMRAPWPAIAEPPETLTKGTDALGALALRALWQATVSPGLPARSYVPARERTALLLMSGWGAVESTVGYLESMFADAGRFASPRHFTRSVHSSVTSAAAIALGIQGPCETLAFDSHPVLSALDRARTLLHGSMRRADAVLLCWADEKSEWVGRLARIATEKLGRKEYTRYLDAAAEGAVAIRLERDPAGTPIALLSKQREGPRAPAAESGGAHDLIGPYPMDRASSFAVAILRAAGTRTPAIWTEHSRRGGPRHIAITPPKEDLNESQTQGG